jgi:RimJ/RimL family protein N-acetyltransferase
MSRAGAQLILEPLATWPDVRDVAQDVFADPDVRLGLGWQPHEDEDTALDAIMGLFEQRYQDGWRLYEVRHEDRRAGLAGIGPRGENEAWYAIYLLERGEGLGARVTERFVEQAREEDLDALVAITWAENEASHGLLESQGFEFVGEAEYDWSEDSELTWIEFRHPLED